MGVDAGGKAGCLWVPREGLSTFAWRAKGETNGSEASSMRRRLLGRCHATQTGHLSAAHHPPRPLRRISHRIFEWCTYALPASRTWPTPELHHQEGQCGRAASRRRVDATAAVRPSAGHGLARRRPHREVPALPCFGTVGCRVGRIVVSLSDDMCEPAPRSAELFIRI